MLPPIWNIVFLVFLPLVLGTSDSILLEGEKQSGSYLTDILEKKIDSSRVIFDDEKKRKEGSFARNRGQLGFNERKQDEKRYDKQDTAQKGYDKGRHSLGESEAIDQGRNSFGRHGNGYYKKGHHRTGFSNNYHKDESGNNSSFYEDSDDEGGHRSSGNGGVYYGQKSRDSFRDGARDASYNERDRAEQGSYDNRQDYHDYRDHSGGYHDDRYKDDRRNYFQDEAGRYFDRNGKDIHYHREKLYPTIRRNNNYVPSFGHSRHNVDSLSREYYKDDSYDDPYSRSYRYFPNGRTDYDYELYYPYRGHYDRNHRGDFYDNEYLDKYRNGFSNGYYRV
ncbi:PREDICTED: putative uncharacterized protein DDB_G0281733 [Dufourea novaeangliae]|uniref:putative uncharacterized protein DDB_G0281733 n=1 Tax=Dufourea novaeangliae TaxID=178035 RepID=UPI0007672DA0|nr:PREDICTED: putative uncharacterized protein DDB_G0281733 [Dufourea novaeangliae]